MSFAAFHFLRPEWLWAILPAAALGWLVLRNRDGDAASGWAKLVDAHLLQHLAISGATAKRSLLVPVAGFVAVIVTILAVAGPTWEKSEVPSFEGGEPVVAVLSLAQSMNADDLTPTRLKRSVHKLRDILERTQGDERGLVIYSDAPFVAAPLTSDPKVIEQMLPELSTSLMPVLGNRLDLAIGEAQAMLERGNAPSGRIIVIADDAGNDPEASLVAARAATRAGYEVSVLAAGTEEGATLQTADGRAIASQDGQTFITQLSKDELEQIASAGDGVFTMITPGNADLNDLLPLGADGQVAAGDRQDFQADTWVDMGYWLLILPVLLMPFAFRRGLVLSLALVATGFVIQPGSARADTWDDLWATPNQQGQSAFDEARFDDAAALFDAPDWKASADYRAGDYAGAAEGFAGDDYNLGNALAKSGQFEEALAAYDAALEVAPEDEDAQFNRDLIAKLLEQQKQQEQQQDQQQSQDQQQQDQQQSQDQQQDQGGQQDQQSQGEQGQPESDSEAQDSAEAGEQDPQSGQQQEQSAAEQNAQEQQDGGEPDQKEQQAEAGAQDNAEEQAGAEAQTEQQQAEAGDVTGEQTAEAEQAQSKDEESGLSNLLSDLLGEQSEEEPQEAVEASVPGAQPVDQAVEQQLRRVPDDPSGLLRARIRQHYAQARAGN